MKSRVSLIFVFFILYSGLLHGQELIPMKSWRSHFNYDKTNLVEKAILKIFAATAQGLIYYDLEDQSINKLSKVDGLSDAGISALAYNSGSSYLALGYQNGNVDIITVDGIENLPVLLESEVTENKTVNHISFYQGNMNLSTDFGLLVLTPDNQVIEAYQNLGEHGEIIAVRASAVQNEVMYLATQEGVLAGYLANGDNLQDFNNWNRFTSSEIYNRDIISVATAGSLYAATIDTLFKYDNKVWLKIPITLNSGEEIAKLRDNSSELLILTNERILTINSSDVITEIHSPSDASINDILLDNDGTFWYADESLGLTKLNNGNVDHIVLNGPLNNVSKLKIVEEAVYAFPELNTNYTTPVSNGLGYSVFVEGHWKNVRPDDINQFSNITDVINYGGENLIASFGSGMLNVVNSEVLNFANSPLGELEPGTGNTLISGIAVDASDQLWIANFSTNSLLSLDMEGKWSAFNFGSGAASEPVSIAISSNNQIWMSLGLQTGYGVLAYDISADASRFFRATSTSLPSNKINDIVFGREDEVWLATEEGIAYFPFSFGIIEDHTIDVSLPIFDQRILFEDKEVFSLAVDGGNRLWVGTNEGLWLFDENISDLIEHFTIDNSPLPSNRVIDLAIHPETGEVFIATDKGIVSYRSDATQATNIHQKVKIYPNPVLPNFDGWVGVSGLASDVNLKITTITGHLVREINAAGGSASWDIRDYSGRRVSTGVYLVFSANSDGKETFVGKIAVID